MKNKYLTIGLSLTILVAVLGAESVHAQGSGAIPKTPMEKGNPIQSQNKRQKTPHSIRKAAAVRLKKKHKIERIEKMAEYVREHGHKGGSK